MKRFIYYTRVFDLCGKFQRENFLDLWFREVDLPL